MVSSINNIFYVILVFSRVSRCLCEPISDKLEKHNEFDIDGIINSFFPNFNQGGDNNNGGENGGDSPSNNPNQANSPQGNSWNNANANPGINYPGNSQLYPGEHSQGIRPQYPSNTVNNGLNPGNSQQSNQFQYPGNVVNDGIYPGNSQQGQPQFPGNMVNNGNYPGNQQQANPPQYPGNMVNNNGIYPGNLQEGSNNQQYPGNGNNGMLANNPGYPNNMQGNNPQYPGNGLMNGNPNYHYPGNQNAFQGYNPQYAQGNGLNHVNTRPGTNYPTYPSDSNQGNYDRYPGVGNNWNNNRYPNNHQNTQTPFTGTNWNNANGLQNNPDQTGFGNQQAQGFNRNPVIQGQPLRYPDAYQNYNPGLQNGFPSQDANGLNNQLLNGNLQDPSGQYPQLAGIVTTDKADILSNPVVLTTTELPPFTTSTLSSKRQCAQDCPSTSEYSPLCGSDNITYFNKGKVDCALRCGIDVTIVRRGTCVPATGIKRHTQAGLYA